MGLLTPHTIGLTPYDRALLAFKQHLLVTTLAQHGGNRTHAARALGLQPSYVFRLLRVLEIHDAVPCHRRAA